MSPTPNGFHVVLVVQYCSSAVINEGFSRFQSKFPEFFSKVSLFFVEDIESENIAPESLQIALQTAELVLIDVRSNRITARVLQDEFAKRDDVTVVTLLGAGTEMLGLTRLGSFHLGALMGKFAGKGKQVLVQPSPKEDIEVFHEAEPKRDFSLKIVYALRKVMAILGTIIPFGSTKMLKDIFQLMKWWESGKADNFVCILEWIARKYMGLSIKKKDRQRPSKFVPAAFWHPDTGDWPVSLQKFLKKHPLDPDKPTLLVIFYGGYHYNTSVAPVRDLFARYGNQWNIVPFYTDGVFTTKYLTKYFPPADVPFDAMLSLIWFPFNGGPGGGNLSLTHEILNSWNVPAFLGVGLYNQMLEDFQARPEGLSPVQILATVIFPEMDGLVDPIPILAQREEQVQFGGVSRRTVQPYLFQDNIDLMMQRIEARVNLRELPNSEKRVALILLNYPPGESNLGNAAYFDGLLSTVHLLREFQARGYNVDDQQLPDDYRDPQVLKNWLIRNGFVNAAKWTVLEERIEENRERLALVGIPLSRYLAWYEGLDAGLRAEVERVWGPPPGKVQVVADTLYLPVTRLGNIILAIQPSRGDVEDLEKSYHDNTLPPHHEYLAFYYYLRYELDVHAMVHVGTHGTLEFLPGKEVGLTAASCYNHSMVDAIPHFYIYQISNTSEGMIAKRRSLATLLSYQLPPFGDNGVETALAPLEEKIHQLAEAREMNNPALAELETGILGLARETGIEAGTIEELEGELVKLKSALIPEGLHVFGRGYDAVATVEFLWNVQPMIPHRPNLYEYLADHFGLPARARENLAAYVREDPTEETRVEVTKVGKTLLAAFIDGSAPEHLRAQFPTLSFLTTQEFPGLVSLIRKIANHSQNPQEIQSLFSALNGDHIPVKMGGDPVRTPAVLPSGSNLYQFNPQFVPTAMAMKRGWQAAEQTLALYKEEYGAYPKNIAVVLWGFETAKTHGETVGEILGYMGVKLSGLETWKREPELVPLAELGRPRVNVTINICGFMRDLFSHVLEILDDAVDLVVDAGEDGDLNFVKAQFQALHQAALEDGASEKDAEFAGRARIFGPAASEYGSILPTLVESGAWKSAGDLGEAYLNQMQYAYHKNTRARPAKKIFETQLKTVDAINQVRDSVAYAVTDLDHYYEFVGGLGQASKAAGKTNLPPIYISDTSTVKVETTSIKRAIARGTFTRTANPKWVKGMLQHDYSGGKKVADRVNYLMGFAATTEQVDDQTWNQVYNTLVDNEEIRGIMRQNNIYAFHEAISDMLESVQRGLWNATEEQMQKLKELYLELEGLIES